jgi:hypothetical protein
MEFESMTKLTDPHKVAEVLKEHKGNRTAAAKALKVSRWALTQYIPRHIVIECTYKVKNQPATISTTARTVSNEE